MKVGMGASAGGKKGTVSPAGYLPGSSGTVSIGVAQNLPGTRTLHLSTGAG
ncbi:hypothetical protein SHKM778_12470 [Streptomyces sp. KM77-8]|uniref:Uncharacterized protein n=1 Tax=Streptomyces haneummycinicus TaxID=3074435 RepID=A0AAT9HBU9_9ACTN